MARTGSEEMHGAEAEASPQGRMVLAGFPLQPYPDFGDIEAASVNVSGYADSATLICMAQLAESRAALGLFQYGTGGARGALAVMLAWDVALQQMLAGAYPATALSEARLRVAERCAGMRMVTGVVAIVHIPDNQISFASIGTPVPAVYTSGARVPLSTEQLRPYGVHAPGTGTDETKLYLKEGDWFVAGTAGLQECTIPAGRRKYLVPPGWLGSSTAVHLAARVHTACRRRRLAADVAMLALHVPTVSARTHLVRRLGFGPREPVTLTTLHYYEDVDQAAAGVLRAMDRQGYRDSAIRQMKMVLAELLVNALEHGNGRDPAKRVVVGYDVDRERAKVSIMDEGKGFDPSAVPDPTKEGNLLRERGRGLFLVRHFTDELRFNAAGNRVTVVKKFMV